mgnify:CR=1 FL=1
MIKTDWMCDIKLTCLCISDSLFLPPSLGDCSPAADGTLLKSGLGGLTTVELWNVFRKLLRFCPFSFTNLPGTDLSTLSTICRESMNCYSLPVSECISCIWHAGTSGKWVKYTQPALGPFTWGWNSFNKSIRHFHVYVVFLSIWIDFHNGVSTSQ